MMRDGKTYIWLPTPLTFNRIPAEFVSTVNAVHTALGKPTVAANDPNPYYFDLNDLDMGGAPFYRDALPGKAMCGPIINAQYISLDYVALICLFGGDVEGLPVYFELTAQQLLEPVPEQFPNRLGANDVPHTWQTWGGVEFGHGPKLFNNKYYRCSLVGQKGEALDASLWQAYRNSGRPVLIEKDYLAIAQATPSTP